MKLLRLVRDILSNEERSEALRLLLLMFIGMLFEMLGVGLVIPLVSILTQGPSIANTPISSYGLSWLDGLSRLDVVFCALAFLVAAYLFKNLFLVFLMWKQSKFAYGVQESLSKRLFFTYLSQPYSFHLDNNSSNLIRNVTTETNLFSSHALMQGLQLIAEGMVVLGIFFLLLLLEPVGTLVAVLLLGSAATLFFRSTRSRVLTWGGQRQMHEGLRLQQLQQGLGAVKDVIISGKESAFLAQYDKHNHATALAARRQEFLKQLPRLCLEWLAISGLVILIGSMVLQGRELAEVVPVFGAFAAAAFRLMPSINRILGAVQSLRYMQPVIDTLHRQVFLPTVRDNEVLGRLTFENEIRIVGVFFSYATSAGPALEDISLRVGKGQMIGFVGPSGSGKSTLIDVLLGLLEPQSGKVLVDGKDIREHLRAWRRLIGYVPQTIYLTDDTLRRNVAFGVPDDQIDDVAVETSIKAAQLNDFVSRLPEGLGVKVG